MIDPVSKFQYRIPFVCVLQFIPCMAPSVPDTPGFYGDDCCFFYDAHE